MMRRTADYPRIWLAGVVPPGWLVGRLAPHGPGWLSGRGMALALAWLCLAFRAPLAVLPLVAGFVAVISTRFIPAGETRLARAFPRPLRHIRSAGAAGFDRLSRVA